MPNRDPAPVFSHGGTGILGWPRVPGTGVSSGNPVEVGRASGLNWPRIQLSFKSSPTPDMTVVTEINPGPADSLTGVPSPDNWFPLDTSVISSDTPKSFNLPPDAMYVRTRITVHAAGELYSMVPPIELPTGQRVAAQYPTIYKGGPI